MKLGLATILVVAAMAFAAPPGAWATVVDLGNAPGSVRLDGQAPRDMAASSLSVAGDVNGDGHPDFIVGSPQSDSRSRTDNGAAFVVYGGHSLAGINHRKVGGVDGFRIDGAAGGDLAGTAVAAAGDFNGDGVDDVIVGARLAGTNQVGTAYVVYGQQTPDLANVDLARITTSQAARGMQIVGAGQFDGTGEALGGGQDLNFDQVDDVIVAAPAADNNARNASGSAYEIYGQRTADPSDVDLTKIENAQAARGMEIDGAVATDLAGFSVAASRDLNDDGIADAIVGAIGAGNNMRNQSGSVYVIYGMNGDDPPDVDLANISTTQAVRGMRIDGVGVLDGLGQSVAGDRDLNGDGIDDAIMGAPRNRNDAGAAYVVYGRAGDAPDVDLANLATTQARRGMRILGAPGTAPKAGWAVDSGRDVNGDGRPDAIVGAFDSSTGQEFSGSAYVVFGQRAADPEDVRLAQITTRQASRGFRIDGAARNDNAGITVAASPGDLNANGRADVLVGTPLTRNSGPDSGSAYVVDLKGRSR